MEEVYYNLQGTIIIRMLIWVIVSIDSENLLGHLGCGGDAFGCLLHKSVPFLVSDADMVDILGDWESINVVYSNLLWGDSDSQYLAVLIIEHIDFLLHIILVTGGDDGMLEVDLLHFTLHITCLQV